MDKSSQKRSDPIDQSHRKSTATNAEQIFHKILDQFPIKNLTDVDKLQRKSQHNKCEQNRKQAAQFPIETLRVQVVEVAEGQERK